MYLGTKSSLERMFLFLDSSQGRILLAGSNRFQGLVRVCVAGWGSPIAASHVPVFVHYWAFGLSLPELGDAGSGLIGPSDCPYL